MDNFSDFTLGAVAVAVVAGIILLVVATFSRRAQKLLLRPWHVYKSQAEERKHLAQLRAEDEHKTEQAQAEEDKRQREIRAAAARMIDEKVAHYLRALRTIDDADLISLVLLTEDDGDYRDFRRQVSRSVRVLGPHGERLADAIRQMGDTDYRPVTGSLGLDLDILLARILDLARAELDDTEATPPGSELAAVLGRCAAVDGEREKARQEQIRRALGIDGEPQPTP